MTWLDGTVSHWTVRKPLSCPGPPESLMLKPRATTVLTARRQDKDRDRVLSGKMTESSTPLGEDTFQYQKQARENHLIIYCVYCIPVYMCEGDTCACRHAHEGQSLTLSVSILFLRQGLSLKVGLTHQAGLAGQELRRCSCLCLPNIGITDVPPRLAFYVVPSFFVRQALS